MTPDELKELRELAGLNTPSIVEQQRKWAENQLIKQPTLFNLIPNPAIEKVNNSSINEIENVANRLNKALLKPSSISPQNKTTDVIKNDIELENVANRLNKAFGSDFSITRLQ